MSLTDSQSNRNLNQDFIVLKHIVVEAPVELCFSRIAGQLESPAEWDPLTIHAWPISATRNRKGAVSLVLLDLGGDITHSGAMIYQYEPYHEFAWSTTGYPRIWMKWNLTSLTDSSTLIRLGTAREQDRYYIDKLWWKLRHQRKLEGDIGKTLKRLKEVLEKSYR